MVAVCTTEISPVYVSFPVVETSFFVTVETNGILLCPCIIRFWAKGDYIHTIFSIINVKASWPVTCLTLNFLHFLYLCSLDKTRFPFCVDCIIPLDRRACMTLPACIHSHTHRLFRNRCLYKKSPFDGQDGKCFFNSW